MAETAKSDWKGRTDGTTWMHRWLIQSLKFLPLRFVYLGAEVFVVPVYLVVNHKGYLAQYHFFRRRLGLGKLNAFFHVWRNHCLFAQTVLDRFYLFSGGRFHIDITGGETYTQLANGKEGFVVLSSHIGCYEVAGSMFNASKPFNAVVYSGESETIQQNRRRMLGANHINIIPAQADMSHVFAISNALANGEVVSIAADRVFGSPRTVTCRFFDAEAKFPLGPFALAEQRNLPVVFVSVMKDKPKHYHIYIKRLDEGIDSSKTIRQRIPLLAQNYASSLESIVRRYPTQWYNFFEFWEQ
ncbi:MAG: acyltransferase [Prevotella sp.]|jgi:predicted LPLAT superfamily acyltransferase